MAEVTQADINAAADILDAIAAEVGHEQQSNVSELRALLLAIRHRTEAVKPLVEALEAGAIERADLDGMAFTVQEAIEALSTTPGREEIAEPKFKRGDRVEKISGSSWRGLVVGEYSTALTPEGYAVESETETGSVQIYPAKALQLLRKEGAEYPATESEKPNA